MKKVLKVLSIIIVVFLAVLILIPIVFKGKIMDTTKTLINENINAKVEFTDVKLSVFRSFPKLNVRLDSLSITGIDKFEGDTLMVFDLMSSDIDIMSLFGDEIEVKKIRIENPRVLIKVLKDGTANYDIAKETEPDEEEEPDTTATNFKLGLQKFEIINGNILYDDAEFDMSSHIYGLNYTMSGDLTADSTTLFNIFTIDELTYIYEDIAYLSKARLEADADIQADLNAFRFVFNDNRILLNEIALNYDGFVAMPADDIDMEITFSSGKSDFKSLLSLIPAIYMTDFDGLEASGEATFDGFVKGTYNDEKMPLFGVNVLVENGRFQYPDLPEAVENVSVNMRVESKDDKMDVIETDIKRMHIEMAKNPFDAKMYILTTPDDIEMNGETKGTIDFDKLKDVIPLDSMSITGLMNLRLAFDGKMSSIENEDYEDFYAEGEMGLRNFVYQTPGMPDTKINLMQMAFSPEFIELSAFDALIGKSDMQMKGKLENYIAYIFRDQLLTGSLDFSSELFDANEFLTDEETQETTEETDTVPLEAFEIPENIDFRLKASIKKVLYDKLEINDIFGTIVMKESRLALQNMKMNLLEGSMKMNGFYDAKDISQPKADFLLDINNFDISSTFNAFNTVQKIAPIAQYCKGNISTKLTLKTTLDNHLEPVYETLNGNGTLQSRNIGITNAPVFTRIGEKLRIAEMKNPTLRNVAVRFTITNGNIEIEPFDVKLAGQKATIKGKQGVDQSIDYSIATEIPTKKAGEVFSNITNLASRRNVDVTVEIGGTLTDPEISNVSSSVGEAVKEEVKQKVKEKVEEKKKQVKEEMSEKAKKIIADADKQAQKVLKEAEIKAQQIKENAEKLGDEAIKQADEQGKKLIEKAGNNPIAKKAAEKSAEKLNKEAKEKADRLNREAEEKADKIMEEARQKAEKIRTDAEKQAERLEE